MSVMGRLTTCNIVFVGKRRDGGLRFWCLEHKADATLKHGKRAQRCRYAHIEVPTEEEILDLNLNDYPGGVAIWGAVPPVYDTTRKPIDRGIHVHARSLPDGEKDIDDTYRIVRLTVPTGLSDNQVITISELDAIYYMVSSVFGHSMKYVECTLCKYPHLDKDWFSLHRHISHLCAGCGKKFSDTGFGIGNPLIVFKSILENFPKPASPKRSLHIKQKEYLGGIQIWGTNEAIVWTATKAEEEGIHIHAYSEGGVRILDDTYDTVNIDGIELNPTMVRIYTAQAALPHLEGKVQNVECQRCGTALFDTGEFAYTPHDQHECLNCNYVFKTRKIIANPLVAVLELLKGSAVREPQKHDMGLLPETL